MCLSVCPHVCVPCGSLEPMETSKRVSDLLEVELQVVVSCHVECWKTNPGHLQEKQVLLTAGPSFLPLSHFQYRSPGTEATHSGWVFPSQPNQENPPKDMLEA